MKPITATRPEPALRPLGTERSDARHLLPRLDPGDIVSARIEGKLRDGSFKIIVAGQALSMVLPASVAARGKLELKFIGREPNLTFALQQAAPQIQASALSAAGRLVAATMLPAGAAALPPAAPLLAAAPADAAALGAALERSVAQSGLFHESHLVAWLAGERELVQILREPQARIAQSPRPRPADPAAPRTVTLIHAQAVPLVQQQLDTLDTARVLLQLEVWPGQWMQWEVDERAPGAAAEATAAPSCATRLRLDLPQLGEVSALLALDRAGVHINIAAARGASADLLQTERASLHAALAAAGMPPISIAVTWHAQP